MIPNWKIYPRSQGHSTVYLQNVVTDPFITVGDHTTFSATMCSITIRSATTTG